jgi:energy-coupling factor transporter ATP-binding protein EcfA2
MSHIAAIVEHDIDRVLGFSQRVTVMNQGEILMTGSPDELRHAQSRPGAGARRPHLRARPRAVIHQGSARPLLTDLAYRKQILWV